MQVKKWSISEVGWWEENTVVDKKEQRKFRDALILLNSESKSPQTKEKGSSALFVPSHHNLSRIQSPRGSYSESPFQPRLF